MTDSKTTFTPLHSKLLSSHNIAILVIIVFGVFFCLESLVNHYLFRTASLDLGAYSHAMYDYSRFRFDYSTLVSYPNNILSDHFAFYTMLISPLSYLFGSYTLLIFQIAAILWGGWGCYTYFKWKTENKYVPLLALLHFFCIWAIYSALSFDYHDNVVAAMFVPWFIYFFEKQRWKACAIYFVLILIAKENMALWMMFIAIGLLILHRKSKWHRNAALLMSCLALLYFVATIKIFMPFFDSSGNNEIRQLSRYGCLGNTFTDIIRTLVTKPGVAFSLFLNNTTGDPVFNGIKTELHLMVLLAGGWALLFRPAYLVMLIPIYGQKMLSNDYSFWGINAQYSIEFAPILTIVVFSVLLSIKKNNIILVGGIIIILITGISTIRTMNTRVSKWYNRANNNFFIKDHYSSDLNIQLTYQLINSVPKESAVFTHNTFVPHLALRDKIYCYWFPDVKDATYILLPLNQSVSTWPNTREKYDNDIKDYLNSPEWKVLYKDNSLLLLKKITSK